jgi:hypothetical protein
VQQLENLVLASATKAEHTLAKSVSLESNGRINRLYTTKKRAANNRPQIKEEAKR